MSDTVREEKKFMKGNMVTGPVGRSLIMFALPMIIGNLFQQFYNIIDSIIVGKFVSEDALAAVGATNAITMLFVMVAIGTGIGCSVIISQLFGANRLAQMKSAVSTAIIAVLVFSFILSVIGLLINESLLNLMKTPENVFDDAAAYLAIYFYAFIFLFMYNVFSAIFNALGDSKKPLIFLIFSAVLNIFLDMLFVIRFGMGVPGVAWATLIAQAISAVLSFCFLMRKLKGIETEKFKFFDVNLLKKMIGMAIPTIIQQSIVSVGMLLVQIVVNGFGSAFLAGYSAALKIDGLAIVPMVNMGNAVSTFTAQNMGAKQIDRVKKGFRIGLLVAALIGVFITVIVLIWGRGLIGLFLDVDASRQAFTIGVKYLRIVSIFYFLMGIMNVTQAVLRGAGDKRWFTTASLINLLTRVALSFAFASVTGGMVVAWSVPIGWGVGFAISYFRYLNGKWKEKRLI